MCQLGWSLNGTGWCEKLQEVQKNPFEFQYRNTVGHIQTLSGQNQTQNAESCCNTRRGNYKATELRAL